MSNSRRNFLKTTIAAGAAIPIVGSSSVLANSFKKDQWSVLSNDELLIEFEKWVDAYVEEVKKEKANPKEFKNNNALVDLPSQMEEMMPLFKERFEDSKFMKSYLQISRKLTLEIDHTF